MGKPMILKTAILLIFFLLASCVSIPECVSGDDLGDSARVVVYREAALIGFAASQPIQFNDCYMGKLRNGSYLVHMASAGKNSISILNDFGKPVFAIEIEMAAGETYYLRRKENIDGVFVSGSTGVATGSQYLQVVDKSVAESELPKLKDL